MADPKYPKEASSADWKKEVGDLDTQKVFEALKKLETLFEALPLKLYDDEGLETAEDANDRLAQAIEVGGRAAKALSEQAKAVGVAVDKVVQANKKNTKAAKAVKHAESAGAAAEALGKEIVALSSKSANAIKQAATRLEEAEKKKDEKDKDKPLPVNPKLLSHNAKVKSIVNKVRAGTHPRTPFAVLQNKVRQPFNKSKPWTKKTILHVGPRALKSCRSELEKLMLPETSSDFVFFFGEVEGKGPKGKLKLVFEFESPLANSKAMKDALLFQCKYSPPMQLRKQGGTEVVDEDAEGDEKDAEGDDEGVEDEAEDTPAGWVGARPSATEDAAIEDARRSVVDAHGKLQGGIADLMKEIADMYKGVTGEDLKSVQEALRRLDGLKKKLDSDLGPQLAAVVKEKDAKERAKRKTAARNALAALGDVLTKDELIGDIDKNDLLPSMNVVGPMRESLRKAIAALS